MKILFLLFFIVNSAFAELSECDGTWTNTECKIPTVKTLEEKEFTERSKDKTQVDKKNLALLDLYNLKYRAQNEYDLNFFIGEVDEFCLDQSNAYQDCLEKISDKHSEISKAINEKEMALAKLKKEKPVRNEDQVVNVTVVDNRDPYYEYLVRKEIKSKHSKASIKAVEKATNSADQPITINKPNNAAPTNAVKSAGSQTKR